jgi:DNA-binding transcriptional LysR family regulator
MLERMLQAGKLDMIFTMIPYERSNLEVIPLVEDELLIALPTDHPASLSVLETYPELRKKHSFPVIDLLECKDVNFVLSGRDRLKYTQLSALRNVFDPEIGFETDSLASAVAIASYMPHGTVIPKLFSTLYDGTDKPMFFRCKEKLPQWSFALSLPKNVAVSEAGCRYIELFVNYIHRLGLLNEDVNCEGIINQIKAIKAKKSIG